MASMSLQSYVGHPPKCSLVWVIVYHHASTSTIVIWYVRDFRHDEKSRGNGILVVGPKLPKVARELCMCCGMEDGLFINNVGPGGWM